MAKKREARPEPAPARAGMTPDRFARLFRLLLFLGGGAKPRERVLKHLKQDVRSFYRDLGSLRAAGVTVSLAEGRYALEGSVEDALERLPFPDPRLTLGEARLLGRGRSAAHTYLRGQVERLAPRR